MEQTNRLKERVEDLLKNVDSTALMNRSLIEWRPVLAEECGCYVFSENYLCKRFDQINYKFCSKDEAKEIIVDNLYALLRFKYFPKLSETAEDRIKEIIDSFTTNLKTTLKKVSLDENADCTIVNLIPDTCVAFRNGVFDFKKNNWLFKYEVVNLSDISNKMYIYDSKYVIQWYFDYNFEPIDVDIMSVELFDFVDIMKELTKTNRNYCFELLYNIAHDHNDQFSFLRFNHLCEILGYTIMQSFSQYFVMLIGSGQNGKNSLFDGCFSNKIFPRPAANDLDAIENDRFITGSLENRAHNIFLETSAKTYTESKMIKALTGSMYQTIESKGINKYSGVINCKYVFAGNDQDKIKFSDTTVGFRRRINMMEIFYRWDSQKAFMKKGDYYDTTFSDSLYEIKRDPLNTTAFIYFAMYGILSATRNFTDNFKFTYNDWNYKYTDIDLSLKEKIYQIGPEDIVSYMRSSSKICEECKELFYDLEGKKLYNSYTTRILGYTTYDELIKMFEDPVAFSNYFANNDVYMSVKGLQNIVRNADSSISFTQTLKKSYGITSFKKMSSNKTYVKCSFVNQRLRILT